MTLWFSPKYRNLIVVLVAEGQAVGECRFYQGSFETDSLPEGLRALADRQLAANPDVLEDEGLLPCPWGGCRYPGAPTLNYLQAHLRNEHGGALPIGYTLPTERVVAAPPAPVVAVLGGKGEQGGDVNSD